MIRIAERMRADISSDFEIQDDLAIQVGIISIIEYHMQILGQSEIFIKTIIEDYRTSEEITWPKINDAEILKKINYLETHFAPLFKVNNGDSESILKIGLTQIDWENIPATSRFGKIRQQITDELMKKYRYSRPSLLIDECNRLRDQIEKLMDENISEIVVTCGILGKDDIKKRIESMIGAAEKRLYLMVAYYEMDTDFFASYLAKQVLHAKLDFRIMYRPKDASNGDLILKLINLLEPSGYTDFYRAYDHRYLDRSFSDTFGSGPVKNLHAKLVVSEKELLIGSANLTHLSLNSNLEMAVYTKNRSLIESTIDLYEQLWRAFDKPNCIE